MNHFDITRQITPPNPWGAAQDEKHKAIAAACRDPRRSARRARSLGLQAVNKTTYFAILPDSTKVNVIVYGLELVYKDKPSLETLSLIRDIQNDPQPFLDRLYLHDPLTELYFQHVMEAAAQALK